MSTSEKETETESTRRRPDVHQSHEQMMSMAVHDAGRWSYGVKAVEVWQYTSEGRLQLVDSGCWVDPVYFQNDDPVIHQSLQELFDPHSQDFGASSRDSLAPGEGLSGALWSNSFQSMITTVVKLNSQNMNNERVSKRIAWRDITAFARDPDQPFNNRTQKIVDAGFHFVAGVPFNVRGTQGIVVLMTRKNINMQKLQNVLNEEYILSISDHIGSILALREPRYLCMQQRKDEAKAIFRKARILIKFLIMWQTPMTDNKSVEHVENIVDDNETTSTKQEKIKRENMLWEGYSDIVDSMKSSFSTWKSKMKGGGILPPPGTHFQLVWFSFAVAFLAFYFMAFANTFLKTNMGNDLGFELSQLGSMTPLVYTLSAAPSAQPRTIVLGQIISMAVGLIFSHGPGIGLTGDEMEYDSPMGWFRIAVAVSISSALMSWVGVAHPPGGALTITFLGYSWKNVRSYQKIGVILIQDALFILIASVLNNAHPATLYPTYWGHIPNWISARIRDLYTQRKKVKAIPDDASIQTKTIESEPRLSLTLDVRNSDMFDTSLESSKEKL